MNKDDEIMALAIKHNVDGCLSHNIRLLAFANACEKIGMEKAAAICSDVSFERRNQGNHIGFNAIHECIDAIRAHKE